MTDKILNAAAWLKTAPGIITSVGALLAALLAFGGNAAAVWRAPDTIEEVRVDLTSDLAMHEAAAIAADDSVHSELHQIQRSLDRQLFILCDQGGVPARECRPGGN